MKERDDGDDGSMGTMVTNEEASSNDSYETINLVAQNNSQKSRGVAVGGASSSPEMMSPSMAEPSQLPSTTIVLNDGLEYDDDDEEDDIDDDNDSFKSIEIVYQNESVEIGRAVDTSDDKEGDRSPSITSTVQTPPPNRITISVKNLLTAAADADASPDNNRNNDDDVVPGGSDRRSPEFPHTPFEFVYDVVSGSPSSNKNENPIVRI